MEQERILAIPRPLRRKSGWHGRDFGREPQDVATFDARSMRMSSKTADLSFFLRHRRDGQPVLGPGQRHVVQPALFLM